MMNKSLLRWGAWTRGLLLVSASCLSLQNLSAEIIPQSVRTDWSGVGIPGGIPNRTTIYTTLTPSATVADINNAINNCPSNQVVFLSAGTYTLNGRIQMKNGVTLRGAGPASTILVNTEVLLNNPNYNYPYKSPTVVSWTSGHSQGETNLVLSSTSGLQVGQILAIDQLNVGIVNEAAVCSSCDRSLAGNRSLQEFKLVTAINGNTVTISPGVYAPLFTDTASPQAWFWPKAYTLMMAGVEDLRINGTPGGQVIDVDCAYACWVKNVYVYQGNTFGIRLWGTKNIEIRHCTIDTLVGGSASSIYGFEFRWSSDFLVEDNIITTVPNDKWEGISGGVFAYNFGTNFVYSPSTWLGETMMLHGGFPHMNLWEGNYFPNWLADNIKGSGGYSTLFRNRLTGWEAGKTGGTYAISVYQNEYYVNVVGNILGTRGYHTVYSSSAGGGNIYQIGTSDPFALSTILRHGNYDMVSPSIVWTASIADHNIPSSLFRSTKPAYFGDRAWPPYDPVGNPNGGTFTNIPAGYRYLFGVDPPTGPPNNRPVVFINATPRNTPTNVPVTFTSTGTYDPEGVSLSYMWTFGDGATSTSQNPIHAFSTNGTFNVRLDVSDGPNTTSTNISITVTLVGVNLPPTASAAASVSAGPAPLAVNFSSAGSSDPDGTALSYNWNFGDGTSSTSANPSKTYSNPGAYVAQLTVGDGTNTSLPSTVAISVGTAASGLVAAYGFDEGVGTAAGDISGNRNNGVVNGATWSTSGRFGNALSFGSSSMVTIADSASLDLTSGMTLEAWVNPSSLNSSWKNVIFKPNGNPSTTNPSYLLQGCSPSASAPSVYINPTTSNLAAPSALPVNTWSHIAATYDGATLRFFVNGLLVATRPQTGAITASTDGLSIGGNAYSGQNWSGLIDEVRVYNRALSATEIHNDMNVPVSGTSTRPAVPQNVRVAGP
jgi:PKD repeat protein